MALSDKKVEDMQRCTAGLTMNGTTNILHSTTVEALLKQVYEVHISVTEALQKQVLQLTEQLSAKEQRARGPCGKCNNIQKAFEKYKANHHEIVTKQESRIRALERRLSSLASVDESKGTEVCATNEMHVKDVESSVPGELPEDTTFLSPSLLGGDCKPSDTPATPIESSPSLLQNGEPCPAKLARATPKRNSKGSANKQRKLWDGSFFVSVKSSGVRKSTVLNASVSGDAQEVAHKQTLQYDAEEDKISKCVQGGKQDTNEDGEETAEDKDLDFHYCHSPVRKKAARQELPAHDCKECRLFYEGLENGEELMRRCSRHRAAFAPPATPEYFWEIDFPDSGECRRRGYVKPTQR
ncbi:uncharacterized protein LOC135394345 isoform X1 [Ornithodoros turicata]|uniref:uncharacterized protein LOC135394345 isoform X1 n=1 Tax=Ornithodoros turicata TaxID=34597 RepID=UPI003139CEAD